MAMVFFHKWRVQIISFSILGVCFSLFLRFTSLLIFFTSELILSAVLKLSSLETYLMYKE